MSKKSGVSSIVSWLMEQKKCQMTQVNWKVSSRYWELHNEDTIEEVMTSTKEFFQERFNYNIFKHYSSLVQLLKQGNVHVMGVEFASGKVMNMYGIITTLDADVSKYGTPTDKIENILSEMIRTAMLIHGYYDLSRGTIIFATPTVDPSLNGPLTEAVGGLNEIFKVYGFQFSFDKYLNQEFTVFNPVVEQATITLGSTKGTKATVRPNLNQKKVVDSNATLKIGILVRNEIGKLARNNQISNEMIRNLLDKRYSQETFGINFPVLKKVVLAQPLVEQTTVNGLKRYWNIVYIINGGEYLICHSWSELQRPKFLKWLELMNE
ncbi:hypothetical protein [Bacillus sp. X1(2014)]|uniref:hypothetical protein n=1 Tax=Bacillus sp. X1(2014) TaxID=1565991 RepID=UPI0011A7327E|nr:hypothetical protein [Bacillus sp. X1(2014)]